MEDENFLNRDLNPEEAIDSGDGIVESERVPEAIEEDKTEAIKSRLKKLNDLERWLVEGAKKMSTKDYQEAWAKLKEERKELESLLGKSPEMSGSEV